MSEGHKLNDVSGHRLPRQGLEDAIVAVQELHGLEVGLAHPDDDDGHGQLGAVDDGLPGLVQVSDLTVRDDQEHKVLLTAHAKDKGETNA